MRTVTRDGVLLWLLAISALGGYLATAPPPNQWAWKDFVQFMLAVTAWGIGKLQASPQPSSQEVRRGFRDNGEPV